MTVHPGLKAFFASATFLLMVGGLSVLGRIPRIIVWLYLGASLIAFFQYALDKSAAQKGRWRIPEATLHQVALIGGWPGALLAQQMLRHKTKKESFRSIFWLTVALNVGALIYLASPYGAWLSDRIDQFYIAVVQFLIRP